VLTQIDNIQQEAQDMIANWDGSLPKPIPMVPRALKLKEFIEWEKTRTTIAQGEIPFGEILKKWNRFNLRIKQYLYWLCCYV